MFCGCLAPVRAAADGTPLLVGKIVYEERLQKDRDRSPAIVVRDLGSLERRVVAAPGMNPRWLPSGAEIAYFLPDGLRDAVIEIPEADEKRIVLEEWDGYRAVFPGRTIVIDAEGRKRRELKHFISDIDAKGRLALTLRPAPGPAGTFRNRRADLLVQDIVTGELSVLSTAEQIASASGGSLRDARWIPGGRLVLYQTETVARNPAGNLASAWALHLFDPDAARHSKLMMQTDPAKPNSGPLDFSISPDGKKIAFSIVEDKNLWVFDIAASRIEKIDTGEPGYAKRKPAFSPDGQFVLFELTDRSDAYATTSFWLAPSAGGRAKRLLPRSWRHAVRFFVLRESDHMADWWQPP